MSLTDRPETAPKRRPLIGRYQIQFWRESAGLWLVPSGYERVSDTREDATLRMYHLMDLHTTTKFRVVIVEANYVRSF